MSVERLTFEPHELSSPTVDKLRRYWAARLDELRLKNEGDLEPAETANLRGRINELKSLLKAVDPTRNQPPQ